MRLGLLGLGRIGELHADTLASLPMVDSLVVADILPDLTTEVADRLGAEPAASPDALLKSDLDGVVIAEACGLSLCEHRPVRMEEVRP